jgi:TolB-like protein/tetratricopeptide (TPR) repeat protein
MSESNKAVFLSYASQDTEAAKRVCEALNAGGVEVWFDKSELRGGDVWDQQIRQKIRDCALFIPVISANTASRHEGYFRLEWDLADQRSHKIARNRPFIIPVCLDATPDTGADVPESFARVQWTRLPAGATPPTFAQRIADLLSPAESASHAAPSQGNASSQRPPEASSKRSSRLKLATLSIALLLLLAGGYIAVEKLVLSQRDVQTTPKPPPAPAAPAAVSAIPAKSIAVLPFVDMSEKKDQEYFSDGLAEDLIDLLVKTQGLEVIARTSSFYFKGKQATIGEIAKTLNVANVLEGSVRKAGNNIRVTAQLIRASDGVHIWSETYDRDLKDVFKVQDEIARGVVDKLKLTLLPAATSEAARTVNPEAHNLYLQARFFMDRDTGENLAKANDYYKRALALDPNYAAAWAGMGEVIDRQVANGYVALAEGKIKAREAANKALELDPKNGEAYAILGLSHVMAHEWQQAEDILAKGRDADPTDPTLLTISGVVARGLRGEERAIEIFRQALARDPLRLLARRYLARTLAYANRLPEAETEIRQVIEANPLQPGAQYDLGRILLAKGEIGPAVAAFEAEPDESWRSFGVPLGAHAQHREADAKAALAVQVKHPAGAEFQIAETYAYFGDADQAFKWLDAAADRDLGIIWLKNDFLLKDLTADPRYALLLRKVNLAK